jgi:hypothetical protein
MDRSPFAWRRFARKTGSSAGGRSHRVRPRVETLEDRTVPASFPTTTNGIHILEDQLPGGMSSAMVLFLATHTDGTEKQTLDVTNQFRAINPNFTLLHYQLGTGNSAYQYIINNQWASDFNSVNQQESWFAHQTYSGEPQSAADLASGRVGNNTGWYQADVANPTWQQYTLNQVLQNMAATGSNAWFADSFTFGIGGGGYDSPVPGRYQGTNAANPASWPGGVTWTTQLGNWARAVETAFAQHNAAYGTDYKFLPNLDARVTSWEPNWYSDANGVPFIDGAFLEGFGQYTDTYNWSLAMNRGLAFTANGKTVIMQPYPSADPATAAGQQQVDFFLGTYLLLKGDHTYLNILYGGGAQYFPEYQLDLGAPTTPLPSSVSGYLWNGVYRRDFQNGFVLVNPGSTTYTLNLGGTYRQVKASGGGTLSDAQIDANGNYIGGSLTYQDAGSATLAGGSAAIFLNPPADGALAVQTPAQASANPVTGTAVGLSVLGQKNGIDTGLTYTWTSTGPAAVSFSANGTNAAKATSAAFTRAGAYTFTANISDGNSTVTSSVQVTVNQTLTGLRVSPATAAVVNGGTQPFTATALDQFGAALASQPAVAWSVDAGGLGTVTGTGLYTAPSTGVGSATVRASVGTTSATAAVTVVANGAASFVKLDGTTRGDWQKSYGADGNNVIGAAPNYPSYATVTPNGQSTFVWASSTTDPRALTNPAGGRIAATWYAPDTFGVTITLSGNKSRQVALYLLDWDNAGRSQRIDVLDAAGRVLDSRTASNFSGGQYLVWNISGTVTYRFTRLAGPNAVLSGLFFGPKRGKR